jgi:hypothetical protein
VQLTWSWTVVPSRDELGEAFSSYEGWQFVLRITDRFGDPRH